MVCVNAHSLIVPKDQEIGLHARALAGDGFEWGQKPMGFVVGFRFVNSYLSYLVDLR